MSGPDALSQERETPTNTPPLMAREVQISQTLARNFEGIWPGRIKIVCKINTEFIQGPLSPFTRNGESSYLCKYRPAALARCIVACSV